MPGTCKWHLWRSSALRNTGQSSFGFLQSEAKGNQPWVGRVFRSPAGKGRAHPHCSWVSAGIYATLLLRPHGKDIEWSLGEGWKERWLGHQHESVWPCLHHRWLNNLGLLSTGLTLGKMGRLCWINPSLSSDFLHNEDKTWGWPIC